MSRRCPATRWAWPSCGCSGRGSDSDWSGGDFDSDRSYCAADCWSAAASVGRRALGYRWRRSLGDVGPAWAPPPGGVCGLCRWFWALPEGPGAVSGVLLVLATLRSVQKK